MNKALSYNTFRVRNKLYKTPKSWSEDTIVNLSLDLSKGVIHVCEVCNKIDTGGILTTLDHYNNHYTVRVKEDIDYQRSIYREG